MFPKQELLQELLEHLSKGKGLPDTNLLNLNDLEKIVLNSGTSKVILSQSAIKYLNLSDKSRLSIIGAGNNFQIWKSDDLGPCDNIISTQEFYTNVKELNLT